MAFAFTKLYRHWPIFAAPGKTNRPGPSPNLGFRFELPSEDLTAVPENRALDAIRSRILLRPDARFLIAAADVVRFFHSDGPPDVRIHFQNGTWALVRDHTTLAALSLAPSFDETLTALRQESSKLAATNSVALRQPSESEAGDLGRLSRLLEDPFSSGPREVLEQVDKLWSDGKRTPQALELASQALVLLNLQSVDTLGMADRLPAKALAILAIREALTGRRALREGALLSALMGYQSDAESYARELPEGSSVRLYIEAPLAPLRESAERVNADPLTRYLFLRSFSPEAELGSWTDWVSKHCSERERGLPLFRTALDVQKFWAEPEIGGAVVQALLAEIERPDQTAEFWRALHRELSRGPISSVVALVELLGQGQSATPTGILKRFERALEARAPRGGVFLDRETWSAFYRSFFYSALWKMGQFYLDGLSSGRSARDFGAFLEAAEPGPGADFQRWYGDLTRVKLDASAAPLLIEDLQSLEWIGQPAIVRAGDDLIEFLPFSDRRKFDAVRTYARRLDSRLAGRTAFARLCWGQLYDLKRYQFYSASAQDLRGKRSGEVDAFYLGFLGDSKAVRAIVDRKDLPEATRWRAFYWLRAYREDDRFLAASAQRLFLDVPRADGVQSQCIRYLRLHGHLKEAESLLRRRLDESEGKDDLERAFYAARLSIVLRQQGRAQEAFDVISPLAKTWRAEALLASAEALEALGKHDEALDLAHQMLKRYPDFPWGRAQTAGILWRQGKYSEVPELLLGPWHAPGSTDWNEFIAPAFFEVFSRRTLPEIDAAFEPLLQSRVNPWSLTALAKPFAETGRHDVSVDLLARIGAKTGGFAPSERELQVYRSLKAWKGEANAVAWLKQNVPAQHVGEVVQWAFEQRLFELIWALDASDGKESEEVWLARASVAAVDPRAAASHRAELEAHFRGAPDDQRSSGGRFLLGLIDLASLIDKTPDPRGRGEIYYYAGLKAIGEGRYEDASDWLLGCVEVPPAESGMKALMILSRWVEKGRSLEVLQRERYY